MSLGLGDRVRLVDSPNENVLPNGTEGTVVGAHYVEEGYVHVAYEGDDAAESLSALFGFDGRITPINALELIEANTNQEALA